MFFPSKFNCFQMAEVEAICAKLQNKTMPNKIDQDANCIFFPNSAMHAENSSDDLNARRRKRKTCMPKNFVYKDYSKEDQFDKSCGALDLRLNNQRTFSLTGGDQNGNLDSDFDMKASINLPNYLQNPLMNIFMNNRENMRNFNFIKSSSQSNIFRNPTNSQTSTDSDCKSEDYMKDISSINLMESERKMDFSNLSVSSNQMDKVKNAHLPYMGIEEECIKRYSSYEECKDKNCQKELLRDHFHCNQCKKIMLRREEMIRHSKWHKKREESLQFNFMRYSPNDDCTDFMCTYNGRQTHYHCLHSGCNKIYISTSDVQMHSNFHKKDAAINEEGFQRYRATEVCSVLCCSYHNQRTTHFHCMRPNCKFTFKNKADMDKHKSHHQRNDSLAKEGFKKYIKYEHCDFGGCKFSKLMNHIHCIRSNCDYVVHSSAQINSHRRKHERRVLSNGIIITPQESKFDCSIVNLSKNIKTPTSNEMDGVQDFENNNHQFPINDSNQNSEFLSTIMDDLSSWENSSELNQEIRKFAANDICVTNCTLSFKEHFHCLAFNCNVSLKTNEEIFDHCRRHKIDHALLSHCYQACTDQSHVSNENSAKNVLHYHCKLHNCSYVRVGPDTVIDFNFLQDIYDHFDSHESKFHCFLMNKVNGKYIAASNESNEESDTYQCNMDLEKTDTYFVNGERKRGRPPKYKKNVQIPKIELNDEEVHDDETILGLTRQDFIEARNEIKCGFKFYSSSNVFCLDDLCMYYGRTEHYHCLRFRCHHATDSLAAVNLHRREFHHYMQIDDGYEYFDKSINCRRNQCQNNRINNHYHCIRHNCDYSFKRFNTMHQHTKKHLDLEKHKSGSSQLIDEQPPQSVPTTVTIPSSTKPLLSSNVSLATHNYTNNNINGMFPFPTNSNNHMVYRTAKDNLVLPIIPPLPNNSGISLPLNMNLNLLMNFNKSISSFQNTMKALMVHNKSINNNTNNNNSSNSNNINTINIDTNNIINNNINNNNNNNTCYSMFPPSSKMPRLQLE